MQCRLGLCNSRASVCPVDQHLRAKRAPCSSECGQRHIWQLTEEAEHRLNCYLLGSVRCGLLLAWCVCVSACVSVSVGHGLGPCYNGWTLPFIEVWTREAQESSRHHVLHVASDSALLTIVRVNKLYLLTKLYYIPHQKGHFRGRNTRTCLAGGRYTQNDSHGGITRRCGLLVNDTVTFFSHAIVSNFPQHFVRLYTAFFTTKCDSKKEYKKTELN